MNQIDNNPKQESTASIILRRADEIAARAEQISNNISTRLVPVTRSAKEQPQTESANVKDTREFPPFFNELRVAFNNIEISLALLEDVLDRTEL